MHAELCCVKLLWQKFLKCRAAAKLTHIFVQPKGVLFSKYTTFIYPCSLQVSSQPRLGPIWCIDRYTRQPYHIKLSHLSHSVLKHFTVWLRCTVSGFLPFLHIQYTVFSHASRPYSERVVKIPPPLICSQFSSYADTIVWALKMVFYQVSSQGLNFTSLKFQSPLLS